MIAGFFCILSIGIVYSSFRRLHVVVSAGNCQKVYKDLACEFAPDVPLKLLVETYPEAHLTVYEGYFHRLPSQPPKLGPKGMLLQVRPTAGTSSVRVVARLGWHFSITNVALRPPQAHPKLQQARSLWTDNRVSESLIILERLLAQPQEPAIMAQAYYLRARIHHERSQAEETAADLRQALVYARRSGLLSLELDILLSLASADQTQEAEALLAESGALLEQVAEFRPWLKLQRGLLSQERGALPESLAFFAEGDAWARSFEDNLAQLRLATGRVRTYQLLGRNEEADSEFLRFTDSPDPCLRAGALFHQASIRVSAMESRSPQDRAQAPLPPFSAAVQLYETTCQQPAGVLRALVGLAHAELLMAEGLSSERERRRHLDAATAALARVSAAMLPVDTQAEYADTQGLLALAKHDPGEAQRQFTTLLGLSQDREIYPSRFNALIGLARTHELEGDTAINLTEQFYRKALDYVDRRVSDLPLGTYRESFLGRYEHGIGRYLAWLYHQGRTKDALTFFRTSRLRGLRQTLRLSRINRMNETQREQWQDAITFYQKSRSSLDELTARMAYSPLAEVETLEHEYRRLLLEVEARLGAILHLLGENTDSWPQSLGENEALLGCHPVPEGWLCFAADAARTQAHLLPGHLDPRAPPSVVAHAMLDPFSEILGPAKRIKVLGYGAMRQIDVHLLPFNGTPLGEQRDVVYSLDLPVRTAAKTVRPAQPTALGLFDPSQDAIEEFRSAPAVVHEIEARGFTLQASIRAGSAALLRKLLSQVTLFHYAGHAESRDGGQLLTESNVGFLATDLLMLERVPPVVTLFGCQTGVPAHEAGGLEGLGVAQAFLLMGSEQVLATVRPVDDRLASRLAVALFRQPAMSAQQVDMVAALREATRDIRAMEDWNIEKARSADSVRPARDLGAFRVFVP